MGFDTEYGQCDNSICAHLIDRKETNGGALSNNPVSDLHGDGVGVPKPECLDKRRLKRGRNIVGGILQVANVRPAVADLASLQCPACG